MKRVLLDVNVNHRFALLITGHEIIHALNMGWAELKNGALLRAAEEHKFDVLITADKQMMHQQNIAGRKLSIIVLGSLFIRWEDIAPLSTQVQIALDGELPESSFMVITPEAQQ